MPINILYTRAASPTQPLLLIHGGAGPRTQDPRAGDGEFHVGLGTALREGANILNGGGSALDAVCAAVVQLENNPLFNAGRGAALTDSATVELDAAVMTHDRRAGALAACRHLQNPVLGARAVMERTDHILLVDPDESITKQWGLTSMPPEHFVTAHRQRQLERVLQQREPAARHGTVGAVALDADGHVACATSTGGMVGQAIGRVGDTALIGAGSFADGDTAALSCTGEGEAFIRSTFSYDVTARMRYGNIHLDGALSAAYQENLERYGATGGTIAVAPTGEALIIHNSDAMLAGYWNPTAQQTYV